LFLWIPLKDISDYLNYHKSYCENFSIHDPSICFLF
jgi:hypothetical protein